MESKLEKHEDGKVHMQAIFSEDEIKSLAEDFHNLAPDHPMALLGGGNDYCIKCIKEGSNFGQKTTVHAGNKLFAFLLGVKTYGIGFNITDGKCK